MIRFLIITVLSLLTFCYDIKDAYAFFTDNYKRDISYGAFKRKRNVDFYIGVRTGFLVKTWTPNIITSISPNQDAINSYSKTIASSLNRKTDDRFTYSIGFDFGIHTDNSKVRHEINIEWYGIMSKAFKLHGNSVIINNKTYEYASLNGKMINSLGTYADIYRLKYSIYYNLENVFKMMSVSWDFFLGAGVGLAYIDGGTYIGSEISGGNGRSPKYKDRDVNRKNIKKNRLTKAKSFAVAYDGKIGVLANISQSFAASIAVSFGGTSRPLLGTNLKLINKPNGVSHSLEYHAAIEIGILLKAYSYAS